MRHIHSLEATLNVTFLRLVRPGRIVGRGRVAHRDGRAFLEASLFDSAGEILATANATARVIPLSEARAAA